MPAPLVATYSLAALVAAHTSFLNLIDAGAGAGYITIRNDVDLLLAQVPLSDPGGVVNAGTGQLVLSIAGPDPSANADGTAAYGEICDSTGLILLALPAARGAAPVSGKLVLNTLAIGVGSPVDILSATIG